MSRLPKPTSPSMQRILAVLREHGPMTAHRISALAFVAFHTLSRAGYLHSLHRQGLIRISSWHRNLITAGPPTPVWCLAEQAQADAPRPEKMDNQTRTRRRRKQICLRYGKKIGKSIIKSARDGGVSVVSIDGQVVYRRKQK